jgi:hypothetical protein
MDKVEILCDDRGGGTREVEREAVFDGAEVMEFEDEVLREVGFVAPDDPADADVGEAVFVPAEDGIVKPGEGVC